MTKVKEVAAAVNDFIDTWQRNSAVIVTIFGERDISELTGILEFLKGIFMRK